MRNGSAGKNALPGKHGLADMNRAIIAFGQIEVNAGAETYHAETLSAGKRITLFGVGYDAACDKSGVLTKGLGATLRSHNTPGVAYIVFGSLVRRGMDE